MVNIQNVVSQSERRGGKHCIERCSTHAQLASFLVLQIADHGLRSTFTGEGHRGWQSERVIKHAAPQIFQS
jgi:hypothetical protein